jgi:hypothetical protein
MTQSHPTIRRMTNQEQVEYDLCTEGLMMEQGDKAYRLSAGTTDTIHVYQTGAGVLFVLTINRQLEYVALDYYMGSEQEPVDNIFLQGEAIKEMVGHDWHSLPLSTLSTKLTQLFA